jgi:hypothetical protein
MTPIKIICQISKEKFLQLKSVCLTCHHSTNTFEWSLLRQIASKITANDVNKLVGIVLHGKQNELIWGKIPSFMEKADIKAVIEWMIAQRE